MSYIRFACPKCKRKSVQIKFENVTCTENLTFISAYVGKTDPATGKTGIHVYRRRGWVDYENERAATRHYICKSQKCDFEIPAKSQNELYEWLMAHNMLRILGNEKDQYVKSIRPVLIDQGDLTVDYLMTLQTAPNPPRV